MDAEQEEMQRLDVSEQTIQEDNTRDTTDDDSHETTGLKSLEQSNDPGGQTDYQGHEESDRTR
jgi:hypothetical protein